MYRKPLLALAGFVLLFTSVSPLAETVSGHTAGQFRVNESGAATYNVPLTLPAGTAGVAPKLAVSYSSHGRNSLLGVGASLSGLPRISRCPATLAQDGFVDGVDFDTNDRFCLDGERLMVVSGDYGAPGSEYRTEQNSFRRVVANGSGPSSFVVHSKNGMIHEFGTTDDSRIEATGRSDVLFWAVSRVSDTTGNHFAVIYSEDSTHGEVLPRRIDYTGNTKTGLEPTNVVLFHYEARPDTSVRFMAGSRLRSSQRLARIEAYDGDFVHREYRFTYDPDARRSQLIGLTECGRDGSCFAPTTFDWRDGAKKTETLTREGMNLYGSNARYNWIADFDGDGKTDIASYVAGSGGTLIRVHYARQDGFENVVYGGVNIYPSGASYNWLGDYDGDGRTDIASYVSGSGGKKLRIHYATGAGFRNVVYDGIDLHASSGSFNWPGDFDGDGRTDLASWISGSGGKKLRVHYATDSGFTNVVHEGFNLFGSSAAYNWVADFDGDGRSDVASYISGSGGKKIRLHYADASGFRNVVHDGLQLYGSSAGYNYLGDYNGDGLTDIASWVSGSGGSQLRVHHATGTGFTNTVYSGLALYGPSATFNWPGDYNGDGRTDIATWFSGSGGSSYRIHHATPDGFDSVVHTGTALYPHNGTFNWPGDYNGDGTTDIASWISGSGGARVRIHQLHDPRALVETITTGHGHTTQIDYAPLTRSDVYVKGSTRRRAAEPMIASRPADSGADAAHLLHGGPSMTSRVLPLLLSSTLAVVPPLASETVPGHTLGQFRVNESGAATYSVPITVPAGTAKIEPKLALTYSSQGNNSLLGIGMTLSGLPSISRCPATQAQDGFVDGVDFDATDRFCYGGQRLMVTEGTYGASGSEYRTEQNSFRRVVAQGTAGSGPASFVMHGKDGLIYRFGGTDDSRIEAPGRSDVLFWAADRISDTAGNYLDVVYEEGTGEYRPVRIDYTANDQVGLEPYNSVEFIYEDRPDLIPRFIGGAKLETTRRLSAILTLDAGRLYREYHLTYGTSPASGRSRLESVTECGADGACFAPTILGWSTPPSGFDDVVQTHHDSAGWHHYTELGDFDGDGLTDYARTGSGTLYIGLSRGDGTFEPTRTTVHSTSGWHPYTEFGDFDGDGLTDYALTGSGTLHVGLSRGDGSFEPVISTPHGSTGWHKYTRFGDFDGDGRTDYARTGSGKLYIGLSRGDGSFEPVVTTSHGSTGWASLTHFADFDGDGRTDYARTGSGKLYVGLSRGDGSFEPVTTTLHGTSGWQHLTRFGDFNGDGRSDYARTGSGTLYVGLSRGDGTFEPVVTTSHGSSPWHNTTRFGDFNGDGRTDHARTGSGTLYVGLSRGDGTFEPVTTTSHSTTGWSQYTKFGDFDGDGRSDYALTGSGTLHVGLAAGGAATDLLRSVTTGHGHTTDVAYASLTSEVYSKAEDAEYPERDFQGPLYVVASYSTSNGIGGESTFSYQYAGAKLDLHGRGFRGFERTTITDEQTGIATTLFYERDHRCISSKIRRTEQRQADGTLISEVDNTIVIQEHGDGVFFSYVGESVAKNYELDGRLLATVTTVTEYDHYGNAELLSVDYGDGYTETTVNTYDDDLEKWHLGRLTKVAVTKTAPFQPDLTRVSAFEYDPETGFLVREVVEPAGSSRAAADGSLESAKSFVHDAHGNVTVSTTGGSDVVDRVHATVYDEQRRYVIESTNALGHRETKAYEHGNMVSLTGPNGLTTRWEYDDFGRQVRELRADGTATDTTYQRCDDECPPHAVYSVRSDATGSPSTLAYFDVLDREIRRQTQGFDGTWIFVDTEHDTNGRVARVSEPYFEADTPEWTSYAYDVLGRVVSETAPGGRVTTTQYAGRTVTVTNPLGQESSRTVDARGQLIASTDNHGNPVFFVWDAFGNTIEVRDSEGHETTLTYDVRGNKTSITDPDTGTTTLDYNSLGELVSQTDAKGQTIHLAYDLLGRLIQRSEPEGTATWTFDTRNKGIGKLARVERGDYAESTYYDSLGRPSETRVRISGETFTLRTRYDLQGRPETLIYPSGFGVRTVYNAQGYAQQLRRTSDEHVLWEGTDFNARGQLERARLGNGLTQRHGYDPETGRIETIRAGGVQDLSVTWDDIGNLTSRADHVRGLSESFGYDGLNRLVVSQVSGQDAVTLDYDELGNITYKSDVGFYTYGENGAGPHAVTSIVGARPNTYTYDANGNLVSRLANANSRALIFADGFESGNTSAWGGPPPPVENAAIAYTSFNKPRSIREAGTTLEFDYGPEYGRYRQRVVNTEGTTTKLYVGGLYERETAGGASREIHYIRAGDQVIAAHTVEGGVATTRYLLRDHLGSVQTITDESGDVTEVLSFDAWGLRRNADTWAPAVVTVAASLDRGFTGHEHLDEVQLIHMNGRVYDPVIGRFLSADPFVQVPDHTQSLNRYSYALNNPLSLTDPSGFFFKSIAKFFKKILKNPIVRLGLSIGVGYLTGGLALSAFEGLGGVAFATIEGAKALTLSGAIVSGAGFGFGSSFSAAALAGSGLGDAFKAGLSSALISGLTAGATHHVGTLFEGVEHGLTGEYARKVIAHGVVQGVSTVAQGGELEHGFLAGAFGEVGGSAGGPLGSIIAGGTAAELGGGKFANGAVSAAFVFAFNQAAHARYATRGATPLMGRALMAAGILAVADGPLPVGDVLGGIVFLSAGIYESLNRDKVYLTYILTTKDGRVYVGRTSGYGNPARILSSRLAGHPRLTKGFSGYGIDAVTSSYYSIRGREQQLIDYFGGAISDPSRASGARAINRIRGVSKFNPLGSSYHGAANADFGEIHHFTGHF